MKKMLFGILCISLLAGCFTIVKECDCNCCKNGSCSPIWQETFESTNVQTNNFGAFNDKRYIWTEWTISTNKAVEVKQ